MNQHERIWLEAQVNKLVTALGELAEATRQHPRYVIIAIPSEGITDDMVQQLADLVGETFGEPDEEFHYEGEGGFFEQDQRENLSHLFKQED